MSYFTGEWFADNYLMNDILSTVNFYAGGESAPLQLNKKAKSSGRMLYGYTTKKFLKWDGDEFISRPQSKYKNLYHTKIREDRPDLEEIFKEFASFHFPDFEYDSVQMTKNFLIKRHKDTKNIGDSIICGFGDYKGGMLVTEKDKEELKPGEIWCPYCHNIKESPIRFNGYKSYHYNTKWTNGDRYVLVFYKLYRNLELIE